jgi:hypothetical protein
MPPAGRQPRHQPAAPQSPQDEQRRQDLADEAPEANRDEQLAEDRQNAESQTSALEAARDEEKRQKEAEKAAEEGRTAQPGADFDGAKQRVEVNTYFTLGREVLRPQSKVEVPDSVEVRNGIAAGFLRQLDDDEQLDDED